MLPQPTNIYWIVNKNMQLNCRLQTNGKKSINIKNARVLHQHIRRSSKTKSLRKDTENCVQAIAIIHLSYKFERRKYCKSKMWPKHLIILHNNKLLKKCCLVINSVRLINSVRSTFRRL